MNTPDQTAHESNARYRFAAGESHNAGPKKLGGPISRAAQSNAFLNGRDLVEGHMTRESLP